VIVYTPAARLVAVRVPVVALAPVPGVNVTPAGSPDAESHAEDLAVTGVEEDVAITMLVVDAEVVAAAKADVKTGAVAGVTEADESDAAPAPRAFVATTVKA
jgi:hypothetical protein